MFDFCNGLVGILLKSAFISKLAIRSEASNFENSEESLIECSLLVRDFSNVVTKFS